VYLAHVRGAWCVEYPLHFILIKTGHKDAATFDPLSHFCGLSRGACHSHGQFFNARVIFNLGLAKNFNSGYDKFAVAVYAPGVNTLVGAPYLKLARCKLRALRRKPIFCYDVLLALSV